MPTDLATRRPIRSLTSADLAAFPVWEWAVGEAVELGHVQSFVRPTALSAIPLDTEAQYLVAADAVLNHGPDLTACVEVRVVKQKARMTPLFVTLLNRHLDFSGDETTRVLNQYTRELNTYPVSWQLRVPIGQARPKARKVARSLRVRLAQFWVSLRVAATGAEVLLPNTTAVRRSA